jgi:three-Cys-motif partner protein
MFLNFPIMDMNRNALWRNPDAVGEDGVRRMTAFWGDGSWRKAAYNPQPTLFGDIEEKTSNEQIALAFCRRLEREADFEYVAKPLPMKNAQNAIVYYLVFASPKPVAAKIVEQIFSRHRDERRQR